MKLFEMEHNIVISIKDDTHAKKVLDKINYKKIHGVDPFFIENSKEAQEEIMNKEPSFIIDDTEDNVLSINISIGDTVINFGNPQFSTCKLLKSNKIFLIVNKDVESPEDIINNLDRRLSYIKEQLGSTDFKIIKALETGKAFDEEIKYQRSLLRVEYNK
ncbi:MAG: hypothetical protein LBB45_05985, partial [Methanobrevibacter sp.]|nr:hypothetical protein [Candidatus Methanovirga basalitermitum]